MDKPFKILIYCIAAYIGLQVLIIVFVMLGCAYFAIFGD